MKIKNTTTHFGIIAIALHWLMALLIIGLLVVGLYMVELPVNPEKFKFYGWHKETGILVLFIAFFRIVWYLSNKRPELSLSCIEYIAARGMHWLLYVFMFAMPLSGWLMSSAAGFPVSFFGLFTLPSLISPDETKKVVFLWLHQCLAYALIGVICLHILASLKHHFIDKDNVLRRIFP